MLPTRNEHFGGHLSRALLPFSTCRTEDKEGSRQHCKCFLYACLPRPPASDAELLALIQVGKGQAQT